MGEVSKDQTAWIHDKAKASISPEVWDCMSDDARDAFCLAASALYHWGMQHGRVYAGCGTLPVYHVEKVADIQSITPAETRHDILSGAA